MDLVTITDHDSIEGALTIADRPDVIIGCEITAVFPEDRIQCHIGVLGINEKQHREIQKLRHDVSELMPYLKQERIFSTLNHLASSAAGKMTALHVFSLLPWVTAIETLNGSRLPVQNRTAAALAEAHHKVTVGGSDSHTYRGIGTTYMVCDNARNREEFLRELWRGKVRVEGRQGNYFTLASDILRLTANFYGEEVLRLIKNPLQWRRQLMVICATIGLPLTSIALVGALIHFLMEERFNRNLLFDLVAQPRGRRIAAPEPLQVLQAAV